MLDPSDLLWWGIPIVLAQLAATDTLELSVRPLTPRQRMGVAGSLLIGSLVIVGLVNLYARGHEASRHAAKLWFIVAYFVQVSVDYTNRYIHEDSTQLNDRVASSWIWFVTVTFVALSCRATAHRIHGHYSRNRRRRFVVFDEPMTFPTNADGTEQVTLPVGTEIIVRPHQLG